MKKQIKETKWMWLFVFFDLPVSSTQERRAATSFRQFLLRDGYIMLQYSVYARICRGQDMVYKHARRLASSLPTKGSVRTLQITDIQYGRMEHLIGKMSLSEEKAPLETVFL